MKKLANFYSCYDYKYDAKLREFVRIESSEGYLLSSGKYRQYKTKILPSDLPEWYVYGYFYKRHGYMSAKGIKDLSIWILLRSKSIEYHVRPNTSPIRIPVNRASKKIVPKGLSYKISISRFCSGVSIDFIGFSMTRGRTVCEDGFFCRYSTRTAISKAR